MAARRAVRSRTVPPRPDIGWILTGFADEAGPDLVEQIALFGELGLSALDLRSAWGKNVISMSDAQITEAKRLLDAAGLAVSSVASPIGKISILDEFGPHLAKAEHAARLAQVLGTPYVRVFSFFMPNGDDPDMHRDEVLRRMAALSDVAERHDVVFVHENEKDIYGDVPHRCVDIVESVGSSHLRLAFDPANYVQCGVRPFTDAYAMVRPYIEYMHIKDAVFGTGDVRVAGEGEGEIREIVRALHADGFSGYFSIEPHLGSFDAFGGQCGPELWRRAHGGFVAMLSDEGVPFR